MVDSPLEECDPPSPAICFANCTWRHRPPRFLFCGDGVVQLFLNETCEPPNTTNCDSECQVIYYNATGYCGDGIIQGNETCELPGTITCDLNCNHIHICGDGIVHGDEQCDPPDGILCTDECKFNIVGPAVSLLLIAIVSALLCTALCIIIWILIAVFYCRRENPPPPLPFQCDEDDFTAIIDGYDYGRNIVNRLEDVARRNILTYRTNMIMGLCDGQVILTFRMAGDQLLISKIEGNKKVEAVDFLSKSNVYRVYLTKSVDREWWRRDGIEGRVVFERPTKVNKSAVPFPKLESLKL